MSNEPKIDQLTNEERNAYREYIEKNHPGYRLTGIRIDGDEVELAYEPIPFQRIRRITGYLTGTVDRWNDAKKAELKDRVKHGFRRGEKE